MLYKHTLFIYSVQVWQVGDKLRSMIRTRTPIAAVAQTAERGARNSEVGGSIPAQQHQFRRGRPDLNASFLAYAT
jgi:hypothetical protein